MAPERPVNGQECVFKSRLSSNAGRYDDRRTSSAVREDANAATLDDSGGLIGTGPETGARLP